MELRNLMVIVTNKIGYTYSEGQKQNCFSKIRSNELNFLAKSVMFYSNLKDQRIFKNLFS